MLDDLKIFIEVVDDGSINKAAEKLATYPSTINRRIRVLEDNLKLLLFKRNINSFTLTKDGKRIYDSFKPLFNTMNEKVHMVTTKSKTLQGTLKLVVTPMISPLIINEKLYEFLEKHPDVNFEISGTYFRHNGEEIKFDVGVSFDFPPKNYFKIKKLVEIRAQLFASRKYIEQHGHPTTIAELKKHKFIVLTSHSIGQDLTHLHLKDKDGNAVDLQIDNYNLTVDNIIHTRQLLYSDYGIALISDSMSSELMNDKDIVHILPDYTFCDSFPVYLVRASTTSNLLRDEFINFLNKSILSQYSGSVEESDVRQ